MNNIIMFSLLICIFSILILILIIINLNNKTKKIIQNKNKLEGARKEELKSYFEEEWNHREEELILKQKTLESEFSLKNAQLNGELDKLGATLKEKEKRYEEVNKDLDRYKSDRMKEIDSAAAEYEQRKHLIVNKSVDKYRDIVLEYANEKMAVTKEEIEKADEEMKHILQELEEERRKRAAVNEQILRQRALDEQQDFYRIQLDPNDKDDVEILRSIAPRLRHPEAINKVIWTGYYQKPLAELRKRLLPNGDVSCVYMATRLKTGEAYVGQTTSFDKRLQEHTRSALGIGTLASSTLHRKMAEDGPEHYLWSILEEVPKDKLRERESYYIDFYDSKNYGLNSISGDKK